MSFLTIDDDKVRLLAPMPAVIGQVREALIQLHLGKFDLPQRHSFGHGASIVMPLYHPESSSVVVKTLTLDRSREEFIKGTITWGSGGNQEAIVADAVALTSIRTGAIVGVAADHFAADNASRAVVFGVGAQSADQVRALLAVRPLTEVTLVSRTESRAQAAASLLASEFPHVHFRGVVNYVPWLRFADIVSCATSAAMPLFRTGELAEDVLVTAIGSYTPSMRELPLGLLVEARSVYVDDYEACMAEAGEIIHASLSGALKSEKIVTLGAALQEQPERTGRRVFKSVGLAAQDWAIMRVISQGLDHLREGVDKPLLQA